MSNAAAATTSTGSYGYRSHLPPPARPILSNHAQTFARTMRRVRSDPAGPEAQLLFEKHPLLVAYERLATQLRETHRINEGNWSASGLLRHLGLLLRWPTTDAEWRDAYASGSTVAREREKGERARSNKELGQRADREVIAVINDRVPPLASSLHNYSKWFFMYLFQRRWLPLDAQLPLWSADNRTVRTWADVVCYDLRAQRLVLIELKTGYAYHYDDLLTIGASGPLAHTARNQHQMQLGWMHARLCELTATENIDAYVVRVNTEEGVPEPHALDEAARAYFATTYKLVNSTELLPTSHPAAQEAAGVASTSETREQEIPDLLALVGARKRRPAVSRAKRPPKKKREQM